MIQICHTIATERAKCMDIMKSNPKMLSAKNIVQLSQAILELGMNKGKEGSALGEIKEDPMTANYDAKVTSDGPDTCNKGMANEKIVNPAITELSKEIRLLSGIAFATTNFIPNKN
ncbi:hypothetical protein Ahy_B07g086289 isoform A [Arachis hypogaea]|uniref:Pectinesterase inhibitor domain-containing protein n=1 Tax=Arachis hypogaea TaxID=3818 RepID=A0A444Y9B8_ARAHY|nr:hypothetical protein Ahy_B07g086289 isoform A [Arachis hypogaea]